MYGLCWGAAAVIGPFAGTQLLEHAGPVGLWAGCAIASRPRSRARSPALRRLVEGGQRVLRDCSTLVSESFASPNSSVVPGS